MTQEPPPPRRPAPKTIYGSVAGQAAITSLYDKVLAALPYDHEEKFVQTSFGSAHVLVCGPAAAPPLVIWHGMGAPAPFILRMFNSLVSHFRTYVPDLPYQAGSRTEDAELDPMMHENGKWALEVLRGLRLVPAAGLQSQSLPLHVGILFGAAVLVDLAVLAPEAIRGAALVVPGGLMPVSLLPFLLRIMLPSLLYLLLPCLLTARLALSGMHVGRRPELPGGHGGFPPHQLARLAAPTIVICAERDIFWPGKAVAAAAAAALPDCMTVIIPGARHLPAQHKMEAANGWILDYFAGRGFVQK